MSVAVLEPEEDTADASHGACLSSEVVLENRTHVGVGSSGGVGVGVGVCTTPVIFHLCSKQFLLRLQEGY